MAMKIVKLDEDVARKIAAGEVITRPAACVKELVDNSLDAGASRIEIKIKDGGKRSILVVDDGCGMSHEDAVMAFERHATSKITSAEDIDAISTLGFRGEAMPSMATVSKLELKSCEHGSIAGVNVRIEGGDVKKIKDISCAPGTSVEVSSLFYNIPARQKFLKSVSSEMGTIIDVITDYILFYPTVSFRLEHNNHLILQSPASGDPLEAAATVLGRDAARMLLPIPPLGRLHAATVRGFIGRPSYNRATHKNIHLAVNGRQVRNRVMTRALLEAYKDYLPMRRYPIAVLDLIIGPSSLDVNVHPSKEEIRFSNDSEVFQAVLAACSAALDTAGIIPDSKLSGIKSRGTSYEQGTISAEKGIASAGEKGIVADTSEQQESGDAHAAITDSAETASVAAGDDNNPVARSESGPGDSSDVMISEDDAVDADESAYRPGSMPRLRVLGQLKNSYLLCDGAEGLYIIDQHAAHERIVYERLMGEISDVIPATGLLFPLTMTFSYSETVVIEQNIELLEQFGFKLERFGENEFIIKEIPVFLGSSAEKKAVEEMLDALLTNVYTCDLDQMRRELIIQTACHTSIRAGDPLSFKEMEALLEEMYVLKNPYNCPHGRPTVISITTDDLEREFKRR